MLVDIASSGSTIHTGTVVYNVSAVYPHSGRYRTDTFLQTGVPILFGRARSWKEIGEPEKLKHIFSVPTSVCDRKISGFFFYQRANPHYSTHTHMSARVKLHLYVHTVGCVHIFLHGYNCCTARSGKFCSSCSRAHRSKRRARRTKGTRSKSSVYITHVKIIYNLTKIRIT